MTVPSPEELDSFKYSDLQNLAKSLGLRANLKAEKLLKTLKAHLKQEAEKEKETQAECQTSATTRDKIQLEAGEPAAGELTSHVTKMRGRRKTAHRSPEAQHDHSEGATSDPSEHQNADEPEAQSLGIAPEGPPVPQEHRDEDASILSSGDTHVNGNEDSQVPSGGKSFCGEFPKPGKTKRAAVTTPNFKKLHEARFKEMESIDQYMERKKKHFQQHNSLNELKQSISKRGAVTPVPQRATALAACTPSSQRRRSRGQPHGPAGHSALCLKGSAKRSTLSATKMNVRFSAATKDNEHKRSLTKTPARKSPHVTTFGNTPKSQAVLGTPKLKTTKRTSAAVITPLKSTTTAMQTPFSNKKPVFDLKASLSRPLNYEPHKGKLKPWGQAKENKSLSECGNRVSFHKKTYKQPHLQTREEHRQKHEQERKEKKAKVLEARRGLSMA
ncbi:nucleolar and spindle-associated protein 1-like isoform X1 [Ochotona curzoniae]|uniref:nucleolar and spindle-associated protein 1 isoform X1 n=1 Tax=Ochotona curzoniae TaxID=130825 RepID=UPI001B349D70|nr:nucleolar and spindle-associated protein 1 isoform X1 [Ochotona curzoniae]XP_040854013.1 nucleolar and spindle-associated protein 1-like isoform X1 [Ochotona curzoniae]